MEEEPLLGLFALCRHFAEGQHHRRGVGLGQRGVLQGMRTQGMREDLRGTSQEEPHTVGQERRCRHAVAGEIAFHGLDIICAMAAGAVEVLVQHLRGRGGKRGHNNTRVSASGHDVGFEHHTPGAGPRRRSIAALLIAAPTDRQPRTIGRRRRGALLMETPRFLEDRGRVTEHDGVTS